MTSGEKARAHLRSALRGYYDSADVAGSLTGEALEGHIRALREGLAGPLAANPESAPARIAASRYWDRLSEAPAKGFESVLEAARACAGGFHWRVNENYRGCPGFEERFFDNEAFAEVVGPKGLLLSDTVRLGFIIVGDGVWYPWHSHEALELYHTVSGTALWGQGDRTLRAREPGEAIFHESFETHAMKTEEEPVLAMWTWSGAIGCAIRAD